MLQSAKTRALETSGDHSGVNSHKVKKKKEKEAKQMRSQTRLQSDSSPLLRREVAGKVHAGHNNCRGAKQSERGEQACSRLWQVRMTGARGQVDELGGGKHIIKEA